MINVEKYEYRVEIDASNPNYYLPAEIGLSKGDLIVFEDAGAPVRFSAGTAADKVPVTDPTSSTGWTLKSYSAGGGGGGGSALITLINNSGITIAAGTIVTYDEEGAEREVRKATSSDGKNLFISSDEYESGEDMDCYAYPNTLCNVMCDEGAVAVGDNICVSSSSGLGCAGDFATVGTAITAKAAGTNGLVKVQLGMGRSFGPTDLEEGVTPLPTGHLYFYYKPLEEEEAEEPEENNG